MKPTRRRSPALRAGTAALLALAAGCKPPPDKPPAKDNPPAKAADQAPQDKPGVKGERELRQRYDEARRKAKALAAVWAQANPVAFAKGVDDLDKLLADVAPPPRREGGAATATKEGQVGPPKEAQPDKAGTPPPDDEAARRQKAIDERTYLPVPIPKSVDRVPGAEEIRERCKKAQAALDGLRAAWKAADRPQVERRLREIEEALDPGRPPAGKAAPTPKGP
jgi:hypothetical protein